MQNMSHNNAHPSFHPDLTENNLCAYTCEDTVVCTVDRVYNDHSKTYEKWSQIVGPCINLCRQASVHCMFDWPVRSEVDTICIDYLWCKSPSSALKRDFDRRDWQVWLYLGSLGIALILEVYLPVSWRSRIATANAQVIAISVSISGPRCFTDESAFSVITFDCYPSGSDTI